MGSAGWSESSASHPTAHSPGSTRPPRNPPHGDPLHLISFLQTSMPAGCHGGGPGAPLSHLIASLHLGRPPPGSQKTANISRPQMFPGQGARCSFSGGTATDCRAMTTPFASSAPAAAKGGSGTPENPKLTQAARGATPSVTPQPRCEETPSPPHSAARVPPTTAALGMMELPRRCYKATSPVRIDTRLCLYLHRYTFRHSGAHVHRYKYIYIYKHEGVQIYRNVHRGGWPC